MRSFGTIHRGFWSNADLMAAGDDARLLAAYLLTSPHTATLGAFRLPDAYACEDLGWDAKRFRNGLKALSDAGFIRYDYSSKWVWVVKFLAWNRPANPNIWKAIAKAAESVPGSVAFKDEILASAGVVETVSKPLDNSPSPSPSPSPSQEPDTDLSIPLNDGGEYSVPLAELAEFEMAYPRIDVPAEIRKARAWCVANVANRKTRRGVSKFLNSWLSRSNDDAASRGNVVALASVPGGGRREL